MQSNSRKSWTEPAARRRRAVQESELLMDIGKLHHIVQEILLCHFAMESTEPCAPYKRCTRHLVIAQKITIFFMVDCFQDKNDINAFLNWISVALTAICCTCARKWRRNRKMISSLLLHVVVFQKICAHAGQAECLNRVNGFLFNRNKICIQCLNVVVHRPLAIECVFLYR